VPDIISGLNRRLRERTLTIVDYRAIRRQLLGAVRDATVLQIAPSTVSRTVKLLEGNVLRAMDALHVARALEWQADLLLTSDKRQYAASTNAGLRSECIGEPIS
jgi:hypothetical protein